MPTKDIKIPKNVSPADVEHFSTLPLTQPILNDASFSIYGIARPLAEHPRHHTLMAKTWNTPDTITHMLTLTKTLPSQPLEVCRFYTIGSGLNAHIDRLHGGVVAAILDSTLSTTAYVASQQVLADERASVAMMQLNVRYMKPVPTPGSFVVMARVKEIDHGGRKIWLEATMKGGEHGETSHATVEGLWLRIKLPAEKL